MQIRKPVNFNRIRNTITKRQALCSLKSALALLIYFGVYGLAGRCILPNIKLVAVHILKFEL